jgi:hypothetical protein
MPITVAPMKPSLVSDQNDSLDPLVRGSHSYFVETESRRSILTLAIDTLHASS